MSNLAYGTRVQMTKKGLMNFLQGRKNRQVGTVVTKGRMRKEYLIRVLRDGEKYPTTYHENFWEPIKECIT